MNITVVTPALNQLAYLKRCVASVQDQRVSGATVHYRVLDGGSTDGSVEWMQANAVAFDSHPDGSMYEALNRGLDHVMAASRTDAIFAWLNCDEQYLPSALQQVADLFEANPDVDVVCGDALIVDQYGRLLTYWKSTPLRSFYLSAGTLYNLTCAMFFRARVFRSGLRFDVSRRAIADLLLVDQLVRAGVRSAVLPTYVSAYTYAPTNLSNQSQAKQERLSIVHRASRIRRGSARVCRALERFVRGTGRTAFPLRYALYVDPTKPRVVFDAAYVRRQWPKEPLNA
jgi:glycosyltransferase involved in cell wall biosynthesis